MSIHVCYALSTNGEPHYLDLLAISAQAVKRLYPSAKITILTDDQSWDSVESRGRDLGASVRSAGGYRGNARVRSRFVKTQARSIVEGDFLYLDADTLPVAKFDELWASAAPISAAIDRSRKYPFGDFPTEQLPYFERLGWVPPTRFYLNAGVIFWRDCRAARDLGILWHQNWRKFFETVNNPLDQAAFNFSADSLGITPAIVDIDLTFGPVCHPILAGPAFIISTLTVTRCPRYVPRCIAVVIGRSGRLP